MENMQEVLPVDQQPLKPSQWAINIFLSSLPLIGLILLLVWAFGGDGNVHRRAWAKGMLLIALIAIVLGIFFMIIFGVGLFSMMHMNN